MPYFKFLNRERGGQLAQSQFSQLQRMALENYLIDLIRAVVRQRCHNPLSTGMAESKARCSIHLRTVWQLSLKSAHFPFPSHNPGVFNLRPASCEFKLLVIRESLGESQRHGRRKRNRGGVRFGRATLSCLKKLER